MSKQMPAAFCPGLLDLGPVIFAQYVASVHPRLRSFGIRRLFMLGTILRMQDAPQTGAVRRIWHLKRMKIESATRRAANYEELLPILGYPAARIDHSPL